MSDWALDSFHEGAADLRSIAPTQFTNADRIQCARIRSAFRLMPISMASARRASIR
jgi:hypothetical protein